MYATARTELANARRQELNLELNSWAWQGPNYLGPQQLPPRVRTGRKLGSGVEPGQKLRYSDVGCNHPKWRLNYYVK